MTLENTDNVHFQQPLPIHDFEVVNNTISIDANNNVFSNPFDHPSFEGSH